MSMALPAAAEVAGVGEAAGAAGAVGGGSAGAAAAGRKPALKAAKKPAKGQSGNGKAGAAAAEPKPTAEPAAAKAEAKPGAEPKGRSRTRRAAGAVGAGGRKAGRWAWAGNRRVLTAEFVLCMVVLALGSVVSPQGVEKGSSRFLVKGTALSAVFFLLALVASGGRGARQSATALGTLITAAYVLTSSDVIHLVQWVSAYFNPKGNVFSQAEQNALEKAGGNVVRETPSQKSEENVGGNVQPRPSSVQSAAPQTVSNSDLFSA
jgi:hypothetical protein